MASAVKKRVEASNTSRPPGVEAYQVPGSVVGLERNDTAVGACHPRELAERGIDVADMLQHRDAVGGIEGGVAEWQAARISRGKRRALVVRRGLLLCSHDVIDDQVDADQPDLRHMLPADAELADASPAADVQDAVAGTRTKRLGEKLGELRIPPVLPEMLERRRRERIDRGLNHQSLTASSPGTIGRVRGRSPRREM